MIITDFLFSDTLFDMGMVQQLVGLLQTEHDQVHEHITSALLALATDHQQSIIECRCPELGLKDLLQNRMEELEGKEEFQVKDQVATSSAACSNILFLLLPGTAPLVNVLQFRKMFISTI